MLGAHGNATEIQPTQQFADAAFMERYTKPGLDPVTQISTAPAHDTVRRQIGTLLDPGVNLGLLRGGQHGPGTGMGVIGQTGKATLIVAMDPVAQRLPVHRAGFGGGATRMTVHHQRDRQQPTGHATVFRPRRLGAQVSGS